MFVRFSLTPLFALACVLLCAGVRAASSTVVDDRDNTAHTGWTWVTNMPVTDLNTYMQNNNLRAVDIQVASTNDDGTIALDAVLVQNTGAYNNINFIVWNYTPEELKSFLDSVGDRASNVAAYNIDGEALLAASVVSNTGVDHVEWSIHTNPDPLVLEQELTSDDERPIQFKPFSHAGIEHWVALGIHNSDNRYWFVVASEPPSTLGAYASEGYRIAEVGYETTNGTYTGVFDNLNVGWTWYFGQDASSTWSLATLQSERPISIAPEEVGLNNKIWEDVYIQN